MRVNVVQIDLRRRERRSRRGDRMELDLGPRGLRNMIELGEENCSDSVRKSIHLGYMRRFFPIISPRYISRDFTE